VTLVVASRGGTELHFAPIEREEPSTERSAIPETRKVFLPLVFAMAVPKILRVAARMRKAFGEVARP